jgi:hypothetical protein
MLIAERGTRCGIIKMSGVTNWRYGRIKKQVYVIYQYCSNYCWYKWYFAYFLTTVGVTGGLGS